MRSLANAGAHLGAIVASRTADEALVAYRDCAAVDPGSEPGPTARLGLARFALGDRQPARVLASLRRRHPGHPATNRLAGLAPPAG